MLLLVVLIASACADSPHREPVTFSYTGDVGLGNSVFVVGNHADVGAGDVTHAIKLRYISGNVWTAQIAIQAGTQLQYRYVRRSTAPGSWCDPSNATDLSSTQTLSVPAQPAAPYRGKTIYYLSSWPSVNLFYRNGTSWVTASMSKLSSGRANGESFFKVTGIGNPGEDLEFVFNDGAGHFDNPPGGGNYLTADDDFYVQDGNVFPYQPPAAVSTPQIVTAHIDSTAQNIAGRDIHIYTPRGYVQNTTKRYPVVYFHDGQNVFDPGGMFGSWSADATATREIGQGRVRETILVAIDNDGANRIPEYQPPNDSYLGTQGRADAYASFVINNVRPYVDTHYRTLNDPANTLTIGSSLGGLVALYLGREFTTFGKVGAFSAAWWISPNYVAQVNAGTKKPLRVYLDFGTSEPVDDWNNALAMYDTHLAHSYTASGDVTFAAGCGQSHNETAWAARLPAALRYLLPAREEPAQVAQRDYPPRFDVTSVDRVNRRASFTYSAMYGFVYVLDRSLDLKTWTPAITLSTEQLPWATRMAEDSALPADDHAFWRLRATTP